MPSNPPPNRVSIRSQVYDAQRLATTQEDNHFGIETLWDLTDAEGNVVPRGLVKWFDKADGGWGFWPGEGHQRVRVETRDVIWRDVDDGMRRWLASKKMPPCLYDIVSEIA